MLQQLGSCVKFRGKIYRFRRNYQWGKMSKKYRYSRKSNVNPKYPGNALKSTFPGYSLQNLYGIKNGSKEARTPDLSRVRRTLIPAELCFHAHYYITFSQNCNLDFYFSSRQSSSQFLAYILYSPPTRVRLRIPKIPEPNLRFLHKSSSAFLIVF